MSRPTTAASISGDMLTTSGTTIKGDLEMLDRLGLENKGANDWDDDEPVAEAKEA